ncbi:copper resistance CopC family protein [Clavibacter michiganensis]|uniref:copper resistance CopC family protein n=1 Tax=Clavibacter michiganensis TaxID=28447 RepID=UPI001BE0BEBB|nr:copper resistance CopC family protein [Clavibacter michiganensis]MBT1635294.1 copper resistance protein CopC [Clavibacter michiganensis]
MRPSPRPAGAPTAPRRRLLRVAAALSGAALATAALALVGLGQGSGPDGALPASAHDYLVSSSPAAGSTIDAAPSEVTLTFNDVILDLGAPGGDAGGSSAAAGGSSIVQVTGPDGQGTHFETGCAVNAGRAVTVPVALGGSGEYTVTWRVVSADGHPVSDSIAFTYQAPAGAAASAGSASGPACAAAQEGASGSGAGTGSGSAGGSATGEAGTAAGQEQGIAPYLGVIVGVGIGIVVLAAAAVVLIVVTGRRNPAGAAVRPPRPADDDDGPPAA